MNCLLLLWRWDTTQIRLLLILPLSLLILLLLLDLIKLLLYRPLLRCRLLIHHRLTYPQPFQGWNNICFSGATDCPRLNRLCFWGRLQHQHLLFMGCPCYVALFTSATCSSPSNVWGWVTESFRRVR